MDTSKYEIVFATIDDIKPWMQMVRTVRYNFPGLETEDGLYDYRKTAIQNIKRNTALCTKIKGTDEIVGVLLFSYKNKYLSCLAVHSKHRNKGIASEMLKKMLDLFPEGTDITVATFREKNNLGTAPRSFYKKYGFLEGELDFQFGYPVQKFIYRK